MAILLPLIIIDHKVYPIVGYLFILVGIILSGIAAYEMMNAFHKNYPSLGVLKYIIPIFCGVLVYNIYLATTASSEIMNSDNYNMVYHFLSTGLFISFVIIALAITIFTKSTNAYDMMAAIFTLTYCGLFMGFVINIRFLEPFSDPSSMLYFRGGRSFGYLYSIVMATDVFAFLIGKKFGKTKIAPNISPNKTVAGSVGGLIAGSIVGVISSYAFGIIHPVGLAQQIVLPIITLFISMVISISVQIGDLIASKIKRTYEIKDFGNLFPGHGGVLDRFDSLIYSGAVYYVIVLIIQILHLW
jgi:phosphatidate cytidylyltransferase